MNFRLQEGEKGIKQGKANRSRLLVAQGGELTLTNRRLVFVGHGMNVGEGTISVNLDEIMTYGKAFTFSIWLPIPIPNAFKVVLRDGRMYKFTVSGRSSWVEALGNLLSGNASIPSAIATQNVLLGDNAPNTVTLAPPNARMEKKSSWVKKAAIGVGCFLGLMLVVGAFAGNDSKKAPPSPTVQQQHVSKETTSNTQAKPATENAVAPSGQAQPTQAAPASPESRPIWTILGPSRWEGGQGKLKVRFQVKSQDGPVIRGILEHVDGKVASADITGAINEQGNLQFTYTDSWGNKGKGTLVILSRDTMVVETSETSRSPGANMYIIPGQFTLKRQ